MEAATGAGGDTAADDAEAEEEVAEAFAVLEKDAFKCPDGITEDEFRYLLTKVKPGIDPKELKKFLEFNKSKVAGIIRAEEAIFTMTDEIENPVKEKKGKGKK